MNSKPKVMKGIPHLFHGCIGFIDSIGFMKKILDAILKTLKG